MPDVTWLRSSFCSQDSCVEVADLPNGLIGIRAAGGIRGTKRRPTVYVTRAEWDAFTAGIRAGDFDPPEATQ